MEEAVRTLLEIDGLEELVPEVGMNLAYAMPSLYARGPQDVLAIDGRIFRGKGGAVFPGRFEFGSSRHLARAILTYMRFFPEYRAVINLRFSEDLLELIEGVGLVVSSYDRRGEPEDVKRKEGATIPWGIESAIRIAGKRPDAIFHRGDVGKEPMVLLFARNPASLVDRLREILQKRY